ncbi:hypothetical protein [Hoylesella nanceiensis]|uniref:hypothetical protein n=1 Tax=Hoylesella nanceiensis TaxID=425941 RepID=UPI001CB3F51C|nr:hypothetical protein [Hoylesella nanceiensis]MBF1428315.1 hypothetical protein [Hoylesella nanceiensis]
MMKRILIALLFVFSCIGTMAQNANEHLKFMGIPINGTLESFTQKLVAKGLKRERGWENTGAFSGTFAGESNCEVYVKRIPSRNIVYKTVVCLPSRDTWDWLEKDYNEFKEMLTSKYGEPLQHSETFETGALTSSDYLKISALKEGKCDYHSTWGFNEGIIVLNIFNTDGSSSCFVRLSYYDAINYELAKNSKQDDL